MRLGIRVAAAEDAVVGDVRERRPDLLAGHVEVIVGDLDARPTAERSTPRPAPRSPGTRSPRPRGSSSGSGALLLAAVRHDRRAPPCRARSRPCAAAPRAGELLQHDRLVAVRRALAAVLLGPGQARVARVVDLPAPLAAVVGGQVVVEPGADLGAEAASSGPPWRPRRLAYNGDRGRHQRLRRGRDAGDRPCRR